MSTKRIYILIFSRTPRIVLVLIFQAVCSEFFFQEVRHTFLSLETANRLFRVNER